MKKSIFKTILVAKMETPQIILPTSLAVGRRIGLAREARGLNQAALAEAMGIASHQTISELEKGSRRLNAQELTKLAETLGKPIDYFTDPFALTGEASFSWRTAPGVDEVVPGDAAAVSDLVGLLRWLRLRDEDAQDPLKSSLRLSKLSSIEEAQRAGERLAHSLKLGVVPAHRLLEKVENILDIPVLRLNLESPRRGAASSVSVQLPDFSCVILNRNGSAAQRILDLAQGVFHALTWDAMPPSEFESNEVDLTGSAKRDRCVQLCGHFALSLLLPSSQLTPLFKNVSGREDFMALAHHFQVPQSALAWRLYALRLIDKSQREEYSRPWTTEPIGPQPRLYSQRFAQMLGRALDAGQLSARKAARLLRLNLDDLEALFRDYSTGTEISF